MDSGSEGLSPAAASGVADRVADGNAPGLQRRDNVAPRMAVDVSVVRDMAALRAIEDEWRALTSVGGSGLFRGPDWLIPWWQAYHATLAAELYVLVGRAPERDGGEDNGVLPGEIVCIAP